MADLTDDPLGVGGAVGSFTDLLGDLSEYGVPPPPAPAPAPAPAPSGRLGGLKGKKGTSGRKHSERVLPSPPFRILTVHPRPASIPTHRPSWLGAHAADTACAAAGRNWWARGRHAGGNDQPRRPAAGWWCTAGGHGAAAAAGCGGQRILRSACAPDCTAAARVCICTTGGWKGKCCKSAAAAFGSKQYCNALPVVEANGIFGCHIEAE